MSPGGVHGAERGEERLYEVQQLARRDAPAALGDQLLEGGAVYVLHDDVGGVVEFEEVAHADYLGLLIHLRHRPRLVEKAALALGVAALGAGVVVDGEGHLGVARDPSSWGNIP